MARRWVWSALDLVALICLGQACLLAQRQAAAESEPPVPAVVTLTRAEQDFGRFGTRIYETPGSVVVALKLAGAPPVDVAVERGRIRLRAAPASQAEEIPVPAGADGSRYAVRRVADELRIVFARAEPPAAERL